MKASKFNIFFLHEGYQVGFNTFSNEFIILEERLYELYRNAKKSGDYASLINVHSDFYQLLVEKGFLVDKALDEVLKVKELSHAIDNDESKFELHINPTMNCNFKCWYCYETHIKDSKMTSETIAHTESFIKQVFDSKSALQNFSLSWFGGEPLLYFKKVVVPILKSTYELAIERSVSFSSGITTNGLLIDDEVVEISKKYGLNFFQITLDGNREKHDQVRFINEERGSYDKIVSNIIKLAKNGIHVVVRINIAVDTLDGLNDIVRDFLVAGEIERQFIKFDLHKVWQIDQDIDKQINDHRWYFRSQGFQVISGSHDTVINSCYGDHRNHATINYNGEVFKCTARDFTEKNSEGVLRSDGFIEWNEKLEKRLSSKFNNKPCLECPILPMCGGGCTQQALEHEGVDYCVYGFDNDKKLDLVKNKFLEVLAFND